MSKPYFDPWKNEVIYYEDKLNNFLPQKRNGWEVYIGWVLVENQYECAYIGQGRIGRHNHLTSGKSSCVEANRAYFEGKSLLVEVVLLTHDQEEALRTEEDLTLKWKPLWDRSNNNPYKRLKKG